jgi:hypothetical protein
MAKPQTFDIIAVSIPDSNVRMAVARLMVGADRYMSMQTALDKVKSPPALLFHNADARDAEQHVAKLKSLGVGFRVVRSDGAEGGLMPGGDDPDVLPAAEVLAAGGDGGLSAQAAAMQSQTEIVSGAGGQQQKPRGESVQDVILRHRYGASAAGGGGGGTGGGGSGGGRGSVVGGLEYLRKREEASRRKSALASAIAAAAVVLFGLLFFLSARDKDNNKFRGVGSAAEAAAKGKGAAKLPKGAKRGAPAPKRRGDTDGNQRRQAENYVDSAKTGDADLERQEAFYKIAISFNRYNLQAWHGLLQTYRDMNKPREAREAQEAMSKIFGDEVNSVSAAVERFGELSDAYAGEGGVYQVEHKSKKASKEEMLRDAFNMTRAVRNACNCKHISIHASTGPDGGGLTVTSNAGTNMRTLPEFSKQAEIMWAD